MYKKEKTGIKSNGIQIYKWGSHYLHMLDFGYSANEVQNYRSKSNPNMDWVRLPFSVPTSQNK